VAELHLQQSIDVMAIQKLSNLRIKLLITRFHYNRVMAYPNALQIQMQS